MADLESLILNLGMSKGIVADRFFRGGRRVAAGERPPTQRPPAGGRLAAEGEGWSQAAAKDGNFCRR